MSVLATLVSLAVGLTGFGPAHPGGPDPISVRHVVEIRGLQFRPAELTVAPGDTVVWINRDVVPHTASAVDAGWDSGAVAGESSWGWVARGDGRVPYFCEYHPSMSGVIVVNRELNRLRGGPDAGPDALRPDGT